MNHQNSGGAHHRQGELAPVRSLSTSASVTDAALKPPGTFRETLTHLKLSVINL